MLTVSIHAPAWGATMVSNARNAMRCSFNPRARVGRDVQERKPLREQIRVSIHAPAWGATCVISMMT